MTAGRKSAHAGTTRAVAAWIARVAGMALLCTSAAAQEEAPPAPAGDAAAPQAALVAEKAAHNRLLDIALAGSQLVAVGEQGVILLSADGKTWRQVPSPVDVMLTRLRFQDAQHGWALGYDATILRTTDGGQRWTVQHHDARGRALYDLVFLDAQRGIAVGAYGSYFDTADGGQTWTARESALTELGMHFNAVLQLGDGSLLVAGERGLVARSADAGARWMLLDFPYAGSIFGALPAGEKGVLAYGMRGKVLEAADVSACTSIDAAAWDPYARETLDDPERIAARGWRRLHNPLQESLFGALPGPGGALLVGVNGAVVRHEAAHGTLVPMPTAASETLARVVAFEGRLIGVGRKGVIDLGAAP